MSHMLVRCTHVFSRNGSTGKQCPAVRICLRRDNATAAALSAAAVMHKASFELIIGGV